MLRVIYSGCLQALYAECHYAECRYAECRGASQAIYKNINKPQGQNNFGYYRQFKFFIAFCACTDKHLYIYGLYP
jgi:hypothetical protein